MNGRHLYGNPIEFYPVCKLWLGVNAKPDVDDLSYGFWRRMQVIPFQRTFAGTAQDKTLKTSLRREHSGILNWIVAGTQQWLANGLNPPQCVLDAVAEYQGDCDPFADFLRDVCHISAFAQCFAAQLYRAYEAWANAEI